MKVAVFDSEEDGLLPDATVVWCIVLKDIQTGERFSYGPDAIRSGLEHLSKFDVLIGHNIIQHDLPVFRKIHAWEYSGKLVDTLWMSRVQRPDRLAPPNCPNKNSPHSVEAWGYRLGLHKQEHDDWSRYSPEMLTRCESDVEINHLIYLELLKEGKGEGWQPAHRLNNKLLKLLQQQEEHGWLADTAHMHRCIAQLDRWIRRISAATSSHLPIICEPQETKKVGEYNYVRKPFLKTGKHAEIVTRYYPDSAAADLVAGPFSRVAFRRVDLDSNAETKAFLLEAGWEPLEWNYRKGTTERTSPKLSKDDPFVGIQGSLGRLIALRVKCRHRKSNIEGYLEAVRPDGRISPKHTGFASTGRLKHSVIVNVPSVDSGAFYGRQMRACFIASPGKLIVGADSAGNQMRQLAARMQDEAFTETVLTGDKEKGTDLHSFNKRLAQVDTRTLAKNFFYGIVFGAQKNKIAKVIGCSVPKAQELIEGYFLRMPKLKALIEKLAAEWQSTAKRRWNDNWKKWEYYDGYITGVDGRPILVDSEHKILNYALQSDEAIQMAVSYILIHEEMDKRGYREGVDWSMLIWYHDEFQAECTPQLVPILGEVMCWAIKESGLILGIKCPHAGGYKSGHSWADTH